MCECLLPEKEIDRRVVCWEGCWSRRISLTWRQGRHLTPDHSDPKLSDSAHVPILIYSPHSLSKDPDSRPPFSVYGPIHIGYLLSGFCLHHSLSPVQSHLLSMLLSLFFSSNCPQCPSEWPPKLLKTWVQIVIIRQLVPFSLYPTIHFNALSFYPLYSIYPTGIIWIM